MRYLLQHYSTGGVIKVGQSTFFYPEFTADSYGDLIFNYDLPYFASINDVPTDEPDTYVTASGIIILEPDGQIWLRKVANNYGGYCYSFAKGRAEKGFSLQQNAIKETYEEMGFVCQIDSWLCDVEGDTSTTRFYLGTRIGGHPSLVADQELIETDYIVLTDLLTAMKMLNKTRDKKVLGML